MIGHQTDFLSLVWPGFSMLTRAILFWGMEDWNLGECGEGAGSRPGTVSGLWTRHWTATDGTLATSSSKSVPENLRGSSGPEGQFGHPELLCRDPLPASVS